MVCFCIERIAFLETLDSTRTILPHRLRIIFVSRSQPVIVASTAIRHVPTKGLPSTGKIQSAIFDYADRFESVLIHVVCELGWANRRCGQNGEVPLKKGGEKKWSGRWPKVKGLCVAEAPA